MSEDHHSAVERIGQPEVMASARSLISEEKWSDVISLLETLHEKEGLSNQGLEILADSYSHQKDYGNAVRVYTELSERQPSQAKWFYRLGFQHKMNKEASKSIAAYERCLQLYPSYLNAYLEVGKLHKSEGHLDEARRVAKTGIST
jgi:tetratricopeptide (TPR) repeat protein